jgi:hypothetical protein
MNYSKCFRLTLSLTFDLLIFFLLESCSNNTLQSLSPLPNPIVAQQVIDSIIVHSELPQQRDNLFQSINSLNANNVGVDNDSLMNWAELAYPYYFPNHGVDVYQSPYVYRYYSSTGNYLGVSNGEVYVLGPVSSGKLIDVGSVNSYYCSVFQSNCNQGQFLPLIDFRSPTGTDLLPLQANLLLGSVSDHSIQLSLISGYDDASFYVQYGVQPQTYTNQTQNFSSIPLQPCKLNIDQLATNTQYYYQVVLIDGYGKKHISAEQTFHTARPSGQAFTFTVQADSHLDENSDLNQYYLTLSNVLNDHPDFHIDLGDTFMTEKYSLPLTASSVRAPDAVTVNKRYLYERSNYGLITSSVPLFLVNGNHDGELGWLNDGTAQNISIWASLARLNYFLNPTPSSFFGGDNYLSVFTGQRASWYSWTWGDALFVVLDPFWNSLSSGSTDPWAMTLGQSQYLWLVDTLGKSTAKYKFVFLHNLVGGLFSAMRGGVEAAPFYEWGGLDLNGNNSFTAHRPGFMMPIHSLLVKNKVTAVFHGHDHLYAKQQLDGIIYQEVPQPSAINYSNFPSIASSYNYSSGTILGSSGHMRVAVSPSGVKVQYIHSWLPKDVNSQRTNGQVADEWVIGSP